MPIRPRWSAALALALGAALPAPAAVILVETTADGAVGGFCDLRDAISAANGDAPSGGCTTGAGADVIDMSALIGSIDLESALQPIDSDVTLLGPGADILTVSGQGAVRIFDVASGQVAIEALAISAGTATRGGCLAASGSQTALSIRDVRITGCTASEGGGFANDGANVRIERSLVDENDAPVGGDGAGVWNGAGRVEIVNSTFSANTASGAGSTGGGVASYAALDGPPTETVIHSSTFAGNAAASGGNLFSEVGAATSLTHTIAAAPNAGGNCAGGFDSLGFNLSDDAGCGFDAGGDQQNADPLLDQLGDNGGPTRTHALGEGSPAIDGGNPSGCSDPDGVELTVDQRGEPRPTDGDGDEIAACDVGAFEAVPEPGAAGAVAAALALAGLSMRRRARGSRLAEPTRAAAGRP